MNSKWRIQDGGWLQTLFLAVNDVIMTSLLLLKFINVFANFYLLVFFALRGKIDGTWILLASNRIILSTKLCLDVGNNEYIILCDFGGRIISRLKVVEGELQKCPFPPVVASFKKSPV